MPNGLNVYLRSFMDNTSRENAVPKKRRGLRIVLSLLFLCGMVTLIYVGTPSNIRPAALGSEISLDQETEGRVLLSQVVAAYGGQDTWRSTLSAKFVLFEDWYGNTERSQWKADPQKLLVEIRPFSDQGSMLLMNGNDGGMNYSLTDTSFYELVPRGNPVRSSREVYEEKLRTNLYWFEFPFRIAQAQIVGYGGTIAVDEKTYELVYCTWGNANAQASTDQYLLYIDPDTHLIDYVHYTNRSKYIFISLTAQYLDFHTINGITIPHQQRIRLGSPGSGGAKILERSYHDVTLTETSS